MTDGRYNKILEWILGDKYRIFFHVLFWSFIYFNNILSVIGVTESQGFGFSYVLVSLAVDLAFVYINLYYLLPNFLLKNKIGYYLFFTIISILISLELKFTMSYQLICSDCDGSKWSSPLTMLVQDFIHSGLVLGVAVGLNIVRRFMRDQDKIQELRTASLKSELAYLKQQINPHFLFNSLNNIYVLNRKNPEDASESILLLSDLLRYQLYDCSKDRVLLREEIDYLKNYLQLDKMRKNGAKVDFKVNGIANGMKIAPFMFIPFVENAVKHGMGLDNKSYINIKFDIKKEGIHFSIENSKPAQPMNHLKGGIGLANVKRRLNLLYPKRHNLIIEDTKDAYRIDLDISMN